APGAPADTPRGVAEGKSCLLAHAPAAVVAQTRGASRGASRTLLFAGDGPRGGAPRRARRGPRPPARAAPAHGLPRPARARAGGLPARPRRPRALRASGRPGRQPAAGTGRAVSPLPTAPRDALGARHRLHGARGG